MHIEGEYNGLIKKIGKVAHVSNPREFFKMFPICESCLVKAMCLTIKSHSIIITKPCERFEACRKNPKIRRRN